MQIRFFTIPVHGAEAAAEELNRFLVSQRILAIHRAFVPDGANSAWSICIHFEPSNEAPKQQEGKRHKIDYREVLDDREFAIYIRLRDLRKTLAEAEGVPPYVLFTNEQLAKMVQDDVRTVTAMRSIPGIGEARVKKYGRQFLDLLLQPAVARGGVKATTDET